MPVEKIQPRANAINPVPRIEDSFLRGVLLCPRCGESTLHHGSMTVYSRPEDGARTTEVTISGKRIRGATTPSAGSRNPSSRRDGLAIRFECECCGGGMELTIAQHKGATLLEWRGVS